MKPKNRINPGFQWKIKHTKPKIRFFGAFVKIQYLPHPYLDAIEDLVEEGVGSHVDGDEVAERDARLQPDVPVGVVEGLHESGLQLREEGLEHVLGLGQQHGQRVQDGRLNAVAEAVAQDPDVVNGRVIRFDDSGYDSPLLKTLITLLCLKSHFTSINQLQND